MKKNIEKKLNHSLCSEYETNNTFEKIFDFFLVPILNSLPRKFQKIVEKTHFSAKEIIEHKTTHKALETLYNHGVYSTKKTNLKEKIFQKIWFNTDNSKAVRNRLKAVKREVYNSAQKITKKKDDLRIFSIASGSARAIIETLANLYLPNSKKIYVSFLDKNPEAIEYSKEKTRSISFDDNFSFNWFIDTASNFPDYCLDKKQDIIEMVGLLDYFDDEKGLSLFKIIYNNLEDDGFFITANIDNNKEKKFVTNFIDWKMIYRNSEELESLAIKAGFKKENIKIFYEPLGIHSILVAKK